MENINFIRSANAFACDMRHKYCLMLKEWQTKAIIELNNYCEGHSSIEEYCAFMKAYNKVLISYKYWVNQAQWFTYLLRGEKNGTITDTDRKD